MTRTVAFIQARMSSSRLPGKVLADLGGQPMIGHMLSRVRRSARIDHVAVVTSTDASDDPLAAAVEKMGVGVWRGSLDDVLSRFGGAAEAFGGDVIVRLTGDCPLIDPAVIDAVIDLREASGADYCSNVAPPTFPDGLDVECFTRATLESALAEAAKGPEREHVTLWMRSEEAALKLANLDCIIDASHLRWTVDYPDDIDAVRRIVAEEQKAGEHFDLFDILRLAQANRDILAGNQHQRNEGLLHSLAADSSVSGSPPTPRLQAKAADRNIS